MTYITLEQRTLSRINGLARAIIEAPDRKPAEFEGTYAVIKTSSDDDPAGFLLTGKEAQVYIETLAVLEGDRAVEHLTRADLCAALRALVRDLLDVDREQMKNTHARRERITSFVSELARPLDPYEVMFGVEGINSLTEHLTIGDVVFQEFSQELATEWEYEKAKSPVREMFDDLIGQSVGIVSVNAGTDKKAAERAQELFDRALNILRVCIGSISPLKVWDRQLLQRRGQFRAVRQLKPEAKSVSIGGGSTFQPIDLTLMGVIANSTKKFIGRLAPLYDGTIQPRLRDSLLRSLEWIGTSITREYCDDKVIALCSALEASLTTRDDGQKGEALALRFMLLSMALSKSYPQPGELYNLYTLRSRVVHGSALGVCGETDYYRLRSYAEEAVLNIIELNGTQKQITRPSCLIKFLEAPERVKKAVSWLEAWDDVATKKVTKYAESRL